MEAEKKRVPSELAFHPSSTSTSHCFVVLRGDLPPRFLHSAACGSLQMLRLTSRDSITFYTSGGSCQPPEALGSSRKVRHDPATLRPPWAYLSSPSPAGLDVIGLGAEYMDGGLRHPYSASAACATIWPRSGDRRAELTQLVECQLPKLDVAGSIPVLRSTPFHSLPFGSLSPLVSIPSDPSAGASR